MRFCLLSLRLKKPIINAKIAKGKWLRAIAFDMSTKSA